MQDCGSQTILTAALALWPITVTKHLAFVSCVFTGPL